MVSILGTYLGSGFGICATYISFRMTYKQTEQQYKNADAERKEEKRLEILPYLDAIYINNNGNPHGVPHEIWFHKGVPNQLIVVGIQNMGLGNAINIKVKYSDFAWCDIPNMVCDKIYPFEFHFPTERSEDIRSFDLYFEFSDLQNRKYEQRIILYGKCDRFISAKTDSPNLSKG